jgi:hypothetical protein
MKLAAMASAMHSTSVRQMAQLLGLPAPTPGHPLSLDRFEHNFVQQAIPKAPHGLAAVLLTNLDTTFNPGHVTLSWIDPGAPTFARARSFRVTYFYRSLGVYTLWEGVVDATPGPLQRAATDLISLQGSVGDSTGLGQLFLSVQGWNDFGTGPATTQAIDP